MSGQIKVIVERDGLRVSHGPTDGTDNHVVSTAHTHAMRGNALRAVRGLSGVDAAYFSTSDGGSLFYSAKPDHDEAELAQQVVDAILAAQT